MYGRDVESMSNRSEQASSSFYIQSVVSVLRQSGGRRRGEAARERKRGGEDVFLHGLFRKKKRDGSVDRYVCMESGRKKREREREELEAATRTRGREREREKERGRSGDRPAPEEYKFMSMQHKVASTTSQPIHTHLYPQLSAATPCARFPDRPLRHSSTRSYRSR